MPNHVTNGVTIKHSDKKIFDEIIGKALKKDKESNDVFDFNAIIPMPEDLMVESGSAQVLGMACFKQDKFDEVSIYPWFKKRYPNVSTKEQLKEHLENSEDERDHETVRLGKQVLDNIAKYGYPDWYDWSINKWGTKWNAYSVEIISQDDTDEGKELNIEFDTAWSTPEGIWDELRRQGFEVNGVWLDEGGPYDYIGDGGNFYLSKSVEYWR